MRMIIVKPGQDGPALVAELGRGNGRGSGNGSGGGSGDVAGRGAGASTWSIERLQALNPHLDFKRLEPGSVVLVPNRPHRPDEGIKPGAPTPVDGSRDTTSVSGAVFEGLAADLSQGLKQASTRVRSAQIEANAQRKDVAAALKSASFKKAQAGDAALQQQAEAVAKRFKADLVAEKQTEESLNDLERLLAQELAVLAKLVR